MLKGTHAYKSKAVKKGVKTVCVLTSCEIAIGKHQHTYHCWRRWEMKTVAGLFCWMCKTRHYHVLAFAYIYNAHNYDKVFRITCRVPATACINTIVSNLQFAMKQQLQTSWRCMKWLTVTQYILRSMKNSKLHPFVHPYGSTIKCHDQCSTKPIAKMMSGHGALDGCITLCVMANP